MVGGVLDPLLSQLSQSSSPESEAFVWSKCFWTRLKPDFYAGLLRKIASSFHRGLPLNATNRDVIRKYTISFSS